eukprot:3408158-Pyramimonas_sp.AAC.1
MSSRLREPLPVARALATSGWPKCPSTFCTPSCKSDAAMGMNCTPSCKSDAFHFPPGRAADQHE